MLLELLPSCPCSSFRKRGEEIIPPFFKTLPESSTWHFHMYPRAIPLDLVVRKIPFQSFVCLAKKEEFMVRKKEGIGIEIHSSLGHT